MPVEYNKLRDSQGLATISQALKAAREAEALQHPEKEISTTAKTKEKGQKGASACAQTPDPALQAVVPDKKDKKKRKKRESRDGEPDAQNMGQASEAAAPPQKKKKKERCVEGPKNGDAADVEEDTLPPPSPEKQAVANPSSGDGTEERQTAPQTFRDFYVKTFSSAFASELFDLRQAEGERLSLGLLLRQIESGCNVFSDLERELLQGKAAP